MKAMTLKKLSAAAAVAAFALVSATAQAQLIRAQDDDIEWVLTSSLELKTTGTLQEGDILVSIFEFPTYTIGGVNAIPAGQEITGMAVIQIADISGSTITFQPYTGGFNAISPVDVTGGNAGEGAMIAVFQNDTATFDLSLDFASDPETNCTSLTQCAAEATAGTLLQVDGFSFLDADEFWQATLLIAGGLDIDTVAGLSGTSLVAAYNAALTTFFNSSGTIGGMVVGGDTACDPALLGCIAGPTVSGTVLGGSGLQDNGAFARSDIDAQKLLAVPEPGTLALAGLALLGLAGAMRRRVS